MTRRGFLAMSAQTGIAASLAGVAAAQESRPMNVLFVAVDDLRPELGCYGHPLIQSPHIDALAAAGVVFRGAYCQQAICMATRASLMSGYRPDKGQIYRCGPMYRHVPDAYPLNVHFQEHGYETVSIGKIYHHRSDEQTGWDRVVHHKGEWKGRGYLGEESMRIVRAYERDNPEAKRRGMGPAFEGPDVDDEAYEDGMIAAEAISELQRLKDRPFFLGVGFKKPHLPFNAPQRYWDLYDPAALSLAGNPFLPTDAPAIAGTGWGELRGYHGMPRKGPMPDALARQLIHGYYACVSYMDAQLGRILAELDRLGLRENTVVMLWGDHGWKLGEHSLWCKHTNFEIDTRVPLVVAAPGVAGAGVTSDALVEFIDMYPSLCELCGLPTPEHIEGTSFVPLLAAPNRPWKSAAFSQYPRRNVMGYSMRTPTHRYTEWREIESQAVVARELYDHTGDGAENTNLAGRPETAELVRTLAEKLRAGWQAARPPG